MKTYYYSDGSLRESPPSFFTRFVANTLALVVAAYLINSMEIAGVFAILLSGFIFTVLNAIVKPILILLTLPLTIVTLGLFYPLVNVIIINLLDFIMGKSFEVGGIFDAILVSIVVAIINYAVTHLFKEERPQNEIEIIGER